MRYRRAIVTATTPEQATAMCSGLSNLVLDQTTAHGALDAATIHAEVARIGRGCGHVARRAVDEALEELANVGLLEREAAE